MIFAATCFVCREERSWSNHCWRIRPVVGTSNWRHNFGSSSWSSLIEERLWDTSSSSWLSRCQFTTCRWWNSSKSFRWIQFDLQADSLDFIVGMAHRILMKKWGTKSQLAVVVANQQRNEDPVFLVFLKGSIDSFRSKSTERQKGHGIVCGTQKERSAGVAPGY